MTINFIITFIIILIDNITIYILNVDICINYYTFNMWYIYNNKKNFIGGQ